MGLVSFIKRCVMVLRRAKKPSKGEISLLVKACALAIIVIGVVGFVIRLAAWLLTGG